LPRVENPLRQCDINERIAEIDATIAALQNNPLSEQAVAASLATSTRCGTSFSLASSGNRTNRGTVTYF